MSDSQLPISELCIRVLYKNSHSSVALLPATVYKTTVCLAEELAHDNLHGLYKNILPALAKWPCAKMHYKVSPWPSKNLKCRYRQFSPLPVHCQKGNSTHSASPNHQLLNSLLDANQILQMVQWECRLLGTSRSTWKSTNDKNIYGGSRHLQCGEI